MVSIVAPLVNADTARTATPQCTWNPDRSADKYYGSLFTSLDHYNSASEVVRESLRLLRREDEIEQLQLEELRREIKNSIKQIYSKLSSAHPALAHLWLCQFCYCNMASSLGLRLLFGQGGIFC
jgi:hypothetical protein